MLSRNHGVSHSPSSVIFEHTLTPIVGRKNLRDASCGQVEIRFQDGRTRRIDHCMIALRHELNEKFKVDVKVEPYVADSDVLKTIYLDRNILCDDDFIDDVLEDVQKEITSKYRRDRARIRTCLRESSDDTKTL